MPAQVSRGFAAATAFIWLWSAACAAGQALPSIAVLDFELIDDTQDDNSATLAAQQRRLILISEQLRKELNNAGLYRVLDNAPAADYIAKLKSAQELRACNGCEVDIGKKLDADLVLTAWVQKVSNLILNINIEIKSVASGQTILNKSVDIRGNTDQSWSRGISYMVRDMVEKKQGGKQ
ncbi:MAG TPA: DUF3280 domain-containing protein [Burkholderiales bacterium]|nr:DUF3280 domain-containing protein [Burkholderiales bacterium]